MTIRIVVGMAMLALASGAAAKTLSEFNKAAYRLKLSSDKS
jgi:hypothetical protein